MGKMSSFLRDKVMPPLIGGGLTWSLGYAFMKADDPAFAPEVRALIGGVPGVIFGVLYAFVASATKRLDGRISQFQNLEKAIADLKEERAVSEHDVARPVLESVNSKGFIRNVLKHAKESYRHLPRKSPREFYFLLTEGIDRVRKWDGIHHGSIRTLGKPPNDGDAARHYFDSIRLRAENSDDTFEARRIIISTLENFLEDFKDENVFADFWDNAGRHMKNWMVLEDDMRTLTGLSADIRLDDCALYDEDVFVHYDQKANVITFAYPGCSEDLIYAAVKRLYQGLDDHLNKRNPGIQYFRIGPKGLESDGTA